VGWFRSRGRKRTEPLPANTEFSVVTGDLVLASGQTLRFDAIVPTVFNGTAFPGEGVGGIPQHAETVWFALQVAQDSHPGCRWLSESDVDMAAATADQSAWALANGVNERFG
jgi:hypothetical protein